jgi:hypothetical protein
VSDPNYDAALYDAIARENEANNDPPEDEDPGDRSAAILDALDAALDEIAEDVRKDRAYRSRCHDREERDQITMNVQGREEAVRVIKRHLAPYRSRP